MNRLMMGAATAAFALMAGAAFAQAPAAAPAGAPPPQAPLQIKQVKPGVYMVVGNGGNSTVVVGTTGVVLVDTKNPGEKIYDELNDKIKSVTPLPVKEVLITHHHADHSGNTLLFLNHGVPVVGHQGELEALQSYVSTANPRPTAPSITYNDALTIHAGGVTAEAHHWGAGHTVGDTVVYFPAQKIVSGGDEVVAVTPNVDYPFGGSVSGWLKSLDGIAKLDFDYVIPGHGNDPLTKADVQEFQKKIDLIGKKAIELRKKGVAKDMIRAQIQAEVPEMAPWMMTGLVNDMRLDAFYDELTAAAK